MPRARRKDQDEPRERARLSLDERRAQLLALGLRLFGERSYDELSIDEIARAAGVSKGLLYHYFPSKRDFYVEVVRSAAEQLLGRTDPQEDGPEALLLGLDAYLRFAEDHRAAYLALMHGGLGQDTEVAKVLEDTRGRFVARLTERLGVGDPAPLLRVALRGWIGLVEAACLDWLDRRDLSAEALRGLLAHLLLATLAATETEIP